MSSNLKDQMSPVLRQDVEKKLVECRNKFVGFLYKHLNNPQDAEDVFQDFCIKVLRNFGSINSAERLDAWLSTTLRHALTDHYRRKATRKRAVEAYSVEAKILQPDTTDVEHHSCKCVIGAMADIDPGQAALLSRVDMNDELRRHVAEEFGISVNALGVRIHRARAALKTRIAEICPVCGDGKFMQCECDNLTGIVAQLPSTPAKVMTRM